MVAFEMSDDDGFDTAAFERFLALQQDLSPKWAPRYVRLTEIPVGATNKIDRRRLQRERWNTDDPLFWRPGRDLSYEPFTNEHRCALEARFAEHGRSPTRSS